ncbi:hypothetical protein F5141DRAFT_1063147 [Pisolithus sp. B1]|nr:hypothetical protein F5141DRAFT_1063147 [Pisolithus sp. B1]
MAEIDTHVREEVTRLSSMLQAEKERELANIEQHYARLKRSTPVAKHLDAEGDPLTGPLPMRPQASTPSTLNLDAIKRIRKSRGISKRTRLIGVDIDDNGLDSGLALPEEREGEGGEEAASGAQDNQLDSPPVSAMVEVVTKSVKTALCSLLESGATFHLALFHGVQENHKLQLEKAMEPSYQHDFILAEVCRLFKEKLKIEQDINFITHEPADAADVHAYEYEDGPDPDMDNVTFDLKRNYSSPWNSFLLSFLLHEFQMRCVQEAWPIRKDDDYIKEVLRECYKRLRTLWKNAQPKLTAKGLIETPAEQEARLVEESLILGKESRQAMHCQNIGIWKTVLDRIIAMKSEATDDDLRSWKWLQHLINTLGDRGMSSEESSVENGIKNNIDQELEIIDLQRVLDKDIFCSQGGKPLPRKRAPDNPASSRAPVMALPMALYDDKWILQLTERQRESLKISKESFPWMKIVATLSCVSES